MIKGFVIHVAGVLMCVCSIVGDCHAWIEPPDIYIFDWYKHTPLSYYNLTEGKEWFCADLMSGGPIVTWVWSWPSAAYDTDQTDHWDYSVASCRFDTTGEYYVWATGYDDYGGYDSDWAKVYVFEMDLDASGVSDGDEENPGVFLCYNDDDDNGNGIADREEIGTVAGENDLVQISLAYEPACLTPGFIELRVAYNTNIRIWTSPNKGNLLIPNGRPLDKYYYRWPVGTPLPTLYVEGYYEGTGDLWLLYTPDGQIYPGGDRNHDGVKFTVLGVKITSPVYPDNKFVFNLANPPGVCNVYTSGTTGLSAYDEDLGWSLVAIEGSMLTSTPNPALGPCVAFTYTGLPTFNSEFGNKTLYLSHPSAPPVCGIDVQRAEIYYVFDATNWPGAEPLQPPYANQPSWSFTPKNWYYYYGQTSANTGAEYHRDGSFTNMQEHPYRYYVGSLNTPHICAPIGVNANAEFWGIDTYGWASQHEYTHHCDAFLWWGVNGRQASRDQDGDMIPDDLEPSFSASEGGPYDPSTIYTYPPPEGWFIDDVERKCLFTEGEWDVGSLVGEDWAKPGSQWH